MAAEPKMQSETQPGVAIGTPQQDKFNSYPPEQTAEYPRNNNKIREINAPLPMAGRQTEIEVEDPRPFNSAATNTQSESSSGAVTDAPTQDEPQSYGSDCGISHERPCNKRRMHPNLLGSVTQKEKENVIRPYGLPGPNPGRPH